MSASHGIWERTTSTNQSHFPSVSTIEKAEWIEEDKQAQVTEVKTPEGLLASDAVGSWKRDQERQEVKGTMVPRKFTACTSQGRWQGRGWESSEHLSWPHRDKTYFQLLCEAESRHKSSPQPDILGSSQIGEFLISNEKLKHIVPIRKEMQIRKSGICVHDNRGTVFWQIWVHLYSNKYFSLWLWHFFAWDISEPYWMLLSC